MKLELDLLGKGRLSRRLLGAFFVIAAVLVGAGMMVAVQITGRSLEARAKSQLASDEGIVHLVLRDLEEQVTLYSDLLADAEILTEHLDHPTDTRSLTISLLSGARRAGMRVHLHREDPPRSEAGADVIRKGFLGIRSMTLTRGPAGDSWLAGIQSVAPVESSAGIERVVAVSFPLTPAYLQEIRGRIGSDISLVVLGDRVISTLPGSDVATLMSHLRELDSVETADRPFVIDTASGSGPVKTRVSPLHIGMREEGLLLLTMPMSHLLTAKRTIFLRGLLVTALLLSGASLLYHSLIRRVTTPLEKLSEATRAIARGDLDLRVDVTTRDELGRLATSFNVMVQRLRQARREIEDWNRTLERRVEDRTKSLQIAQTQLEGVNAQLRRALEELRETQEQMIQTEKLAAVGQMASTMAHEIRNPLSGIRAALEVMAPEFGDTEYAEVLEQVLHQVDRLGRTTTQLLSFARPAEPQLAPTRLRELIESTCFLVEGQAERQGVEIRTDLQPPDRAIFLDPQLTAQAFLNIALNALQAMEGKGALTIRSRWHPDEEAVSIAFTDTGPGMPADVREEIFTPFFTTKRHGTGLGLFAVKDIIERQGGDVSVASAPGEGTVITVRLPAKDGAAPA
jgi:signal transduction histidine kinase